MKNRILKNRIINFRSTFIKLIASYLILMSFILCISTLTIYNTYKNQIIDQGEAASQKLISQADYYTQYTLNWAKLYTYQLYLDQDIYNLVYGSNKDKLNVSKGVYKIEQAALLNPSILSIYIYNNNRKTFYTSMGKSGSINDFFDRQMVDILQDGDETFSTKLIPRKIYYNVNQSMKAEKHVLSVILKNVAIKKGELPEGVVILNLNADNVGDYYKNFLKNYDMMAIDMSGKVILSSNTGTFLEDISNRDYVRSILNEKNNNGSFLSTIGKKPSLVNYYKSSDFAYINIIPYDSFLGSMNKMMNKMILIFIILFITGVISALIFSKIIYSPIGKIVKNVKEHSLPEEHNKKENELDYLYTAFDKLLNQPLTLKKLSKKDMDFVKYHILEGIIFGTLSNVEDTEGKFKDLEINLNLTNNLVAVLKIDKMKKLLDGNTEDEIINILNDIARITSKIISMSFKNEAFTMGQDSIILIVGMEDQAESGTSARLLELIEEVQSNCYEDYGVSISAGIGQVAYEINDIAKSYKEANDCINYRFKYGTRSILYHERIAAGITEEYKYDEGMQELAFNALKLGNIKQVELELNKIFENIKNYSYSDMAAALIQFSISTRKVINNLYQMSKENIYINNKEFENKINKFETLEDAKLWMLNIYINAIESLKDKKSNKKNELICKNALYYIDEHFGDPTLSLEIVAENVKISPNYLRILFKDIENKSISSYISECRFKKAKELLETTDMTVIEIATAVGYLNSNYFYTSFKKYYGVTPNQYRNNMILHKTE